MEINKIYLGDCLELMQAIPDKSIDMILCDLPYGTTNCKWDTIIPFEPMWQQYGRVIKDNGAIVLTASQPFTSALIMSNIKRFKYCWIWDKVKGTGFLNAKKQPMKVHEDIAVFCDGKTPYNFIKTNGHVKKKSFRAKHLQTDVYGNMNNDYTYESTERYPRSIQVFSTDTQNSSIHPTQKPVALFEYLIRTYTNEGALVLDNCAGSGTTGIACINTNRNFILMEKDENYFHVAQERIFKLQLGDLY